MPVYSFRCRKCGEVVSVEHRMSEPHPTVHAGCGGALGRIFDSQKQVIFHAGGFYATDKRLDPKESDLE